MKNVILICKKKMYFLSLSLLFILIACIKSNHPIPSKDFSVTQVILWPGNTFQPHTQTSQSSYIFPFVLDSTPSQFNRIFCILSGYYAANKNYLSFYTNLFDTSSPSMALQFIPQGDINIYSVSFSILAVVTNTEKYLSILNYQLTPKIISIPGKSMNVTFTSESWTLGADMVFRNINYKVLPFLSYLQSYNYYLQPGGTLSFGQVNVGTSKFVIYVNIYKGAVVKEIGITVIFVDLNKIESFNKIFFSYTFPTINHNFAAPFLDSSFQSIISSFSLPAIYGPKIIRNCSIGLSTIHTMMGSNSRKILFNYSSSLGITNIQEIQSGGLLAISSIFCSVDCQSNAFFNSSAQQCQACQNYMPKCRVCINSTLCLYCGVNTYFHYLFSKCICDGNWVTGGCSPVKYCIQVQETTGICIRCSSNYSIDPISHQCVCSNGIKGISGVCANILGCITGRFLNGTPVCITCNATVNLVISNNKCICMQGTTLHDTICQPICGDGKVYFTEICDDGNTVNEDGCNSTCNIEEYYTCVNGSFASPSICIFEYSRITWSILKIYKDQKSNTAYYQLKISPYILNMQKMNFSSALFVNILQKHRKPQIKFSDGVITVIVQFLQDLEGNLANFSLNFDSSIISQKELSLNFSMISQNYPLILFNSYEELQLLNTIVLDISILTLLLFIFGSWAHRMIGAETVQVFIIIYYSLASATIKDKPIFWCFSYLRYMMNYGDYFPYQTQSTFQGFDVLKLHSSFSKNNSIILIFLLANFMVLFLMFIYLKGFKKILKHRLYEKNNLNFIHLYENSSIKLIFNVSIIPIMLGYLCHFLNSNFYSILSYYQYGHPFFQQSFSILAIFILLIIILSVQSLKGPTKDEKSRYVLYFFMNYLFISALLMTLLIDPRFIYLLMLWSIFYTIFIVRYRPYSNKIHQIGLTVNQVVVVLWFCILSSFNLYNLSQSTLTIIAKIVIICIALVDFMVIIRICYQLCTYGSQKTKIQQKKTSKDLKNKLKNGNFGHNPMTLCKQSTNFYGQADQNPLRFFQNRSTEYEISKRYAYQIMVQEMKQRLRQNLMNTMPHENERD